MSISQHSGITRGAPVPCRRRSSQVALFCLPALTLALAWIALVAGAPPCAAARIPEYTILLHLEPVNCDVPDALNVGLLYRLPSSETGADNSNYRFREMRPAFRFQGRKEEGYQYQARVNQQTGINYSTLWTLHFAKKRRAVELRFNHPDYIISSFSGDTFFVKAPANPGRSPTLRLYGTLALRDAQALLNSGSRARIDVALDSAAAQANPNFGPVEVQLSDGRPVVQILPSGEIRMASFANLAELSAGATIAPPAENRMFRVRVGPSATQIMTSMNPGKPGDRRLLIRHRDISSWLPPRGANPATTGGAMVTRTNFVTIPRTNLVTVVRTNIVKLTEPVGATAVFALMPQNAPGLAPANYELGFQFGSGAPASLGAFDSKGSLTTAMLPKVDRALPLFFRAKGDSAWSRLPETVNPSGQSPLNIIDAMSLVPGEPVQFTTRISQRGKSAPDAGAVSVKLFAGGAPTGISGQGVSIADGKSDAAWSAQVAGALSAKRLNDPLEIKVEAPGRRQTTPLRYPNFAAFKKDLDAHNGSLAISLRPRAAPDKRGLAIILDPARRWSQFTALRNAITDELFERIDAAGGLQAPLLVGADRGPYDIVRPADFKNADFDLYSFFFNGFRDQSVRGGMMTPKNAAEVIGSMDDDLALAPQLEAHGAWNIVCLIPHNPGGETAGAAPSKEVAQALIDGLRLADASLLVIENGSTSRYLTALQDRVERITGDKSLFRYQSRKELDKVLELVRAEIDKLVPAAPAK